jgi:hypothetical protein
MVREMHNGLFATIDSEQSPLVLLHTIKVEEKKRKRKREEKKRKRKEKKKKERKEQQLIHPTLPYPKP